jgi:hypothetical protein
MAGWSADGMPPSRSPHAPRPSGRALRSPIALRSALAGLLVLTAVGLAACGGSSSSASTATTTSPSTTGATGAGGAGGAGGAAFAKYTTCLKQHGVTLPARGQGGFGRGNGGPPTGATGAGGATGATGPTGRRGGFFGGANGTKFRAAQTACAKLLPANFRGGGGFFGGGGAGGGNNAAFAAYRNCLTLHGVKIGAGFGGFGRRGPQGTTGPQGATGAQGAPKPNAKVTKALTACASLRPKFGGQPPLSTTTTPTTTTS